MNVSFVVSQHRGVSERDSMAPIVARVVPASRAVAEMVEAAYVAHYRDVYRYLLALTASEADAEEITAEVFERAMRTWESEPAPVLPWLLVVARRLATDRWRRAKRLTRVFDRLRRPAVGDADEERTEFWAWYAAVSRVLTDRQREVLALRYQNDLTDAQIADVMGLSESGVRSLVARAVAALRAHPEVL